MNHNGSLRMAKKLVDSAKEAGADAIKFQTFKSTDLVVPSTPRAAYQEENMGGEVESTSDVRKIKIKLFGFRRIKILFRF